MKKQLFGVIALIIAISAAAFTVAPSSGSQDPTYDWRVYDANGNPTSTFLDNRTVAQVQSANPQCNGTTKTCFEAYDDSHTVPQGILISKP